jgi:hypothetical protein
MSSGFPFCAIDFTAVTKLFSAVRAGAAPRRNCTPWPNTKNPVSAIADHRTRNFR